MAQGVWDGSGAPQAFRQNLYSYSRHSRRAVLLFIAGLVSQRLALAVVGLDATSEIVTGMIGTAHHYYFNGLPTFWMYVGAIVSVLETVPLGFMII